MLVTNHWRDTNEVTCLPGMSRALVKVKTLAFHHQQKLLEDMTVFATTLAGRDLLCHQIQAWSRHFCPSADIELQFSLTRRFPRAARSGDYSRAFSLDPILFGKSGQKPVITSLAHNSRALLPPRLKQSSNLPLCRRLILAVVPRLIRRIAPQESLPMPQSNLGQPEAKTIFRMRDKLIGRVRRDNHNIACRKRELDAILYGLSAPFGNIGDARWDHAARLCLFTGS